MLLLTCITTTTLAQPVDEGDFSQKRFYIKAYGGYGLLTPGSYRVESRATYTYEAESTSGDPIIRDTTIVSLGKNGIGGGVRFGGGVGYIINNYLNVGIDGEFLRGKTLDNDETYEGRYSSSKTHSTLDYSVITLTPHVVFKAKSSTNYTFYNRLGILVSLPFTLDYESRDSTVSSSTGKPTGFPAAVTTSSSRTVYEAEGQYEIPISFGLNVALGVQFRFTDDLRGFAEAFANYSVLQPKSYHEEATSVRNYSSERRYISNGALVSGKYSNETTNLVTDIEYQKTGGLTFDYIYDPAPVQSSSTDGVRTTTTVSRNNSQIQKSSTISRNMNAIGLNIGLTFRF